MIGLVDELCKGPVIVIDDQVQREPYIKKIIREIEDANLPVLTYDSIEQAQAKIKNLLFSSFIILDWKMIRGTENIPVEVQIGAEDEEISEDQVIDFIRELQKVCLAPIFIFSEYNKDEIITKLKAENILTDDRNFVFVESKITLCKRKGVIFSRINKWIEGSPHIYISKYLTNEWIIKNNKVFWELFNLNPDWPSIFYKEFKDNGEDPIFALRDTLTQLILAEVDSSGMNSRYLSKKYRRKDVESLKRLYNRLIYIDSKDINNDIRPGDIFKVVVDDKPEYYLNIRPECDTVKRNATDDLCLYLLKGKPVKRQKIKDRFNKKYGVIPWENEIIMLNLDGNNFVQFFKKDLEITEHSKLAGHEKICRVAPPFISQIRQSYTNYLGRFGLPSYPKTF